MDEPSPSQPVVYQAPQSFGEKLKENWMLIVFLPVILVFAFFLNYFNILPLSVKLPQIFGFLPHQISQQATIANQTPASIPPKPVCPTAKESCLKGQAVADGDKFFGLGFTLASGSAVLASIDGTLDDQPKTKGRSPSQPLLYLRGTRGTEAVYSYYGTVTAKIGSKVKSGQEIGKIGPGTFPVSPLTSFNFLYSFKDLKGYQKITVQDFANSK